MKKIFSYYFTLLLVLISFSCKNSSTGYYTLANGEKESCVACHQQNEGFSPYHKPEMIGCSACHLGQISATDKDLAHKGMILIPGNLNNAEQTCASANCHADELGRLHKSLMTTNSGLVSIDRWAFGEVSHTDTLFHMEQIGNSAADRHLRNLCFTCHLGYEKKHYAATSERSRGGGCLACHLNYQEGHQPDIHDKFHPTLNLKIGNDKCFGCHSRSNRISTNYEGWHETLYTQEDVKDSTGFRILEDGRVFAYAGDDVHHQAGMLCVDCHGSKDVMGDGHTYKHESEAVKIQCSDCHTTNGYKTVGFTHLDAIDVKDYSLQKYTHKTTQFIVTDKDSIPLTNTYFDEEGEAFIISKINQTMHPLRPTCRQDQHHEALSCNMCHTRWAPSCLGCHTEYDKDIQLNNGQYGKWIESLGGFSYAPPVMAVTHEDGKKKIIPALPGMIMSLDKSEFSGHKKGKDHDFLRLFAPVNAHTTQKEARSCASCHLNSYAMGFGEGNLTYIVKGDKAYWQFEAAYENYEQDNLPQDAWQGFLEDLDPQRKYAARNDFLPLNRANQKKVLRVGACIYCHKNDEVFNNRLLEEDFEKMLTKRTKACVINF